MRHSAALVIKLHKEIVYLHPLNRCLRFGGGGGGMEGAASSFAATIKRHLWSELNKVSRRKLQNARLKACNSYYYFVK